MYADIVVIGGGASGFAAAISAKKNTPSLQVAIVEKLVRSGKKLIATGNGKCNLSNACITQEKYHGSVDAMEIIGKTPDYHDFFERELGVMCVTGSEGREGGIYPRSNSSVTVLGALRLKLEALGIRELCEFDVKDITVKNGGFVLRSDTGKIECRRIIIAAGGYAGSSFGTDGSMLRILKNMGYKTAKICPAVAPLRVSPESLKGLKGVRVKGIVTAASGNEILRTERGEIQFNEGAVSGICVFNLAYLFGRYEGRLSLRMDLMPDTDEKELVGYLSEIRKNRGSFGLDELMTGIFVKNLAVYIVKRTLKRPMTDKISTVSDGELYSLAKAVKRLEFAVTGCSSWQNAQATFGGIHKSCVDGNLESKLHKGIYFCGEILDTVGDCGGYNLQWAWSSGMWSGKCCAESLKEDRHDKSRKH